VILDARLACASVVTTLLTLLPLPTSGAPSIRQPPRPLPAPPTLSLVRIETARDHVLVIQDVMLGRGDWLAGDIDAFIAFGAPGTPRAVDAQLYVADNPSDDVTRPSTSEAILVTRAFQRPQSARLLLGASSMSGAVLHLREAAFRRATERTGVARVRIRTLIDLPGADVRTGRELLIRLGSHGGEPDALGSIEVTADDASPQIVRAEAHLCGPDADTFPLSVHVSAGASSAPHAAASTSIAPVSSVRHASDSLCVRFWTASPP